MGFIYSLLAVCLLGAAAHAYVKSSCPDPAKLSPCTCDGEGINCNRVKNEDELEKALQAGGGGRYRGLWVQRTKVRRITLNMLQNYLFKQFYVEMNEDLDSIEDGALATSKLATDTVSFFANNLKSFPFKDLKGMGYLHTVNLARNKITEIPSLAFENHYYLKTIILGDNQISHIAKDAFMGLQLIEYIGLFNNPLKTLGPGSLNMETHARNFVIDLKECQISNIDPNAFKPKFSPASLNLRGNRLTSLPSRPFQTLLENMASFGGKLIIMDNPLSCQGCDYRWLASNKDRFERVLQAFQCKDGRTLQDLDPSSIGCTSFY